jgi:predicted  nucleic acid-binding Zn-ribbon protein
MFKEVEGLLAEFKKVAAEYQALNDKYEDLEQNQYDYEDMIDEKRQELTDAIEAKLDKAEKVDKQKCKCCGKVLNEAVTNHKEVGDLEKKLYAELDNHPSIKRLEASRDKAQADHDSLDKRIDKMADTLYEYEGQIKEALKKVADNGDDGYWFNFHTSLV